MLKIDFNQCSTLVFSCFGTPDRGGLLIFAPFTCARECDCISPHLTSQYRGHRVFENYRLYIDFHQCPANISLMH